MFDNIKMSKSVHIMIELLKQIAAEIKFRMIFESSSYLLVHSRCRFDLMYIMQVVHLPSVVYVRIIEHAHYVSWTLTR